MISHSCEGSKPHVRLPSQGIWQRDWESPGNLTVKASRLWLQDSHMTGKQRPHCSRAQTKSCVLQDPGERSSDPTGDWTRPTTTVGGSPMEVGVSSGSSWGQGHWRQQSWKMPLVWVLLEVTINPTTEPTDSRAGSPQAKQLTGREHNPTHQWIMGLKFFWAWPYPPEQDPVFPTTSPSHQEGYTSHLASSTRGQTEEARRTTIPQWWEQNHITDS